MYKELATIKYGDTPTAFVVFDGNNTTVMDIEMAKNVAANGEMDTLDFKDGRFVPIVQGEIADELRHVSKRFLKRNKELTANMTFEDYVDTDFNFQSQDIDLMTTHDDIVLASIGTAFEARVGRESEWLLTIAFWSSWRDTMDHLMETLCIYAPHIRSIRQARNYDGFAMVTLPLKNRMAGFDLLSLRETAGVNFIYNLDTINTMEKRAKFAADCAPFLTRKMMNRMIPTNGGLAGLNGVLYEANRLSSKALAQRNIHYDAVRND